MMELIALAIEGSSIHRQNGDRAVSTHTVVTSLKEISK